MESTYAPALVSSDIHHLSDQELLHTLRMRRRAARALGGVTYSGLSEDTAQHLNDRVHAELRQLEQECSHRGLRIS